MNKNLQGFYWGVACSKPDLGLCGKWIDAIWIDPDLKTIVNHG